MAGLMHKKIIRLFKALVTAVFAVLLTTSLITDTVTGNDLSVSSISPDLLENVNAVIRLDERTFENRGTGNGRMYVRRIVTILNSDGLSHSSIEIPYHSFTKIKKIGGAVYDLNGERVEKIRRRHFDDESMISSVSIAEDSRIKKGTFTHSEYPFTIEIEYRVDYSGFIQLPAWVPVKREKTALEHGSLTIEMPHNETIDYRTFNISGAKFSNVITNDHNRYRWTVAGLNGIERERYGPPWRELIPAVVFRINEFQMDGFTGSLKSWASFGSWIGSLWEGRTELSQSDKEHIDHLIENHGHSRELIQSIYSYLQDNTRYVSIQLGIGGFQTETALSTAKNRYGDCKALSNYLVAMLHYAGVEAYPALIRNGSPVFPFDAKFVHNPFNHSVVTIPLKNDTLWVEATSSSFPAGYIGASNANRYALSFFESGGKLIKTPLLTPTDNFQKRSATVNLSADGDASARVSTRLGGSQHEHIRTLSRQSPRRQTDYLNEQLPFTLFDLKTYEIGADPENPIANIEMEVEISAFASTVGSRLFFYPNLIERNRSFVPPPQIRTQPIHTGASYHDTDLISFKIPEGYSVEAVPEPVSLEFEYGRYSSAVTLSDEGKILNYSREIIMEPGILPVEEYSRFFSFINEIVRSDNSQAVLVEM